MAFGMSPWDPFREFDRMERLFRRGVEGLRGTESFASPAVEVTDEGDHYLVRAELPGVREEDVDITLTGNVLSIRGEKRYEKREGGAAETKGETEGEARTGGTQPRTQSQPQSQSQSQQTSGQNIAKQEQQTSELSRKEEQGGELARPLYSEVYYGRFERTLTLPDDIDSEKVEASYKDGVFLIEIGKKEQHRAKRINITRH